MALNPQTQALQIANQLIGLSGQLLAIYDQLLVLDASWTDNGLANIINKLSTSALNTDGSLGATDATPVVANPINNPALTRAMSSNQITSLKTVLDNIVTYVNGSAVAATPGARGILNSASGG